MFDKKRISLSVLIAILCSTTSATKWLIDKPSFDSSASWTDYLPCSLDKIIFPEDYNAVLPLPKEVQAGGFILPRDGAILLNQESTIDFGAAPEKRYCENDGHKAYIKKPNPSKWFDPHSWRTTADMSRNNAVSHMERVPCNNETVIIQRNGPLTLDLESVPYLRMGQLSLAGSIISKDYLKHLLRTDIGEILFRNSLDVTVEYYRDDVCGCHKDFQHFNEPICHNMFEECERAHCLSPISPLESCCNMCGAILKFAVDSCDDGNLYKLKKLISIAINDQGLNSDLDYHVSYIDSRVLQAVIVDRDNYKEKSVAFVQRLNATTDWAKVFSRPYRASIFYSGRPYNSAVTFVSVLLIILCLLFVAYVSLVIYAHYAPDSRYVNMIPPWVLEPRHWHELITRNSFMFARFHNAGTAGATEERIENLTMRFNTRTDTIRECAFDNPMFNESSKRKEESEPTVETQSLESVNVQASTVDQHIEEQELTEIKLETLTDESEEDETI